MRRRPRRRRGDDLTFGFDSFLDVVANVVGIVIRLIIVVWVGARSYTAWQAWVPPPETPLPEISEPLPELPPDPLEVELLQQRQQLDLAQKRLLEQMRQLQRIEDERATLSQNLTALTAVRQQKGSTLPHHDQTLAEQERQAKELALSSEELRSRSQNLFKELQELEKQAVPAQVLKARSPVSRPVHSEELFFECKNGRVTFIDLETLLSEVKRGLEEKGQQLRSRYEVQGEAGPAGVFRMKYTVERERGVLDGGNTPTTEAGFRYGISGWELDPIDPSRGEQGDKALANGSEFRRIVDLLDARQTTVTLWVYPDSFPLYRALRDYLADRDVVVAGRPLPEGVPIASSRRGTASRGQ